MSTRGLLLFGISSTGPFALKLTSETDQSIQKVLINQESQQISLNINVDLDNVVQGKRRHLEQLEIRSHPEGLEFFVKLKKIPNMIQTVEPGQWISTGIVRNPEMILKVNGILQTKTFQQIVEQTERLAPNEWNAPTQDLEFIEFLEFSTSSYVPESC